MSQYRTKSIYPRLCLDYASILKRGSSLCLAFLLLYQNLLAKCQNLPDKTSLCIERYPDQKIQSLELRKPGVLPPSRVQYFYPDGSFMLIADWEEGFLWHRFPNGFQRLTQGNLEARSSDATIHCSGSVCVHSKYKPPSQRPKNLQTGDIVFTWNLMPWTALNQMLLTHVSIVAEINPEPLFLTNDIAERSKILPHDQAHPNNLAYLVLRNQKFQQFFKRNQKNLQQASLPMPYFCSNFLVEGFQKIYPEVAAEWDVFDKNYIEQLYINLRPLCQNLEFAHPLAPKPEDLELILRKTLPQFRASLKNISQKKEAVLFHLFFEKFPLLPVGITTIQLDAVLKIIELNFPLDIK